MAIVKATLIMQVGSHGWSESFFWNEPTDDLTAQMASLQVIAAKRAALLGVQAYVKAERVSLERDNLNVPVKGDSYLNYIRYNGAAVNSADDPDTAVLVTMRDQTAHRRRNMFLRGIWDDVNGEGGMYVWSVPGWVSAFNSWSAAMLAKRVGWLASTKIGEGLIAGYVCDQDSGYVRVTLSAPSTYLTKDVLQTVRIKGVNGTSPLNGEQLIRGIDSTSFWLEKPLALIAWQYGGVVSFYKHDFVQAFTIDSQKIVTRRSGTPLLESAGRAKAKPRA